MLEVFEKKKESFFLILKGLKLTSGQNWDHKFLCTYPPLDLQGNAKKKND